MGALLWKRSMVFLSCIEIWSSLAFFAYDGNSCQGGDC